MNVKYYKVLNMDRMPCNGGSGQWHQNKWIPPVKGRIVPCKNGYHLCRREDLVYWLGEEIWEAEGRGDMVVDVNKVVFREARLVRRLKTWNDRTARLFAADCAERVLHLYENDNDSKAPANAVQAARDYANGLITLDEMSAARSAAWSASRYAAWPASESAAWSAAWSASESAARSAARSEARSAAKYAAKSEARSASEYAAGSAEREWQTDRLFYYLDGGK